MVEQGDVVRRHPERVAQVDHGSRHTMEMMQVACRQYGEECRRRLDVPLSDGGEEAARVERRKLRRAHADEVVVAATQPLQGREEGPWPEQGAAQLLAASPEIVGLVRNDGVKERMAELEDAKTAVGHLLMLPACEPTVVAASRFLVGDA